MRPRDKDDDGSFPKSVFPPSVFPRRIFPWMGGNDDEDDCESTVTRKPERKTFDDEDK